MSEYYLQLRGHSERELQIVSHELRKRYQNHAGDAAITAKRLADLLAKAEEHEAVLLQCLQDLETRDVIAQLGGYRIAQDEQMDASCEPSHLLQSSQGQEGTTDDMDEDPPEEDEDLENLDEYGEYH